MIRGFQAGGKTPDMLPEELPFADGERRFKRFRRTITVPLPIIFAFQFDVIYLFMIPEGLFS